MSSALNALNNKENKESQQTQVRDPSLQQLPNPDNISPLNDHLEQMRNNLHYLMFEQSVQTVKNLSSQPTS